MLANAETDSADIAVEGGIWDHDNLAQTSNPFLSGAFRKAARASHTDGNPDTVVTYGDAYNGSMMRFFKVTRLSIRNLTMKNPVTYCLQMAYVRYFTVENIDFDMNLGNPVPMNMDGVHPPRARRSRSARIHTSRTSRSPTSSSAPRRAGHPSSSATRAGSTGSACATSTPATRPS